MNAAIRLLGSLALCYSFATIVAAAEEDEPATVSVSAHGTVVDADGKPVAGARVVLREWARIRYSDDPYSPKGRDVLAETVSDEQGQYQFEKVPARLFKGFKDYTTPWDVVALADGHALGWAHLSSAEGEMPVEIKLHEPVSVKGRVIDGDGKPVDRCNVFVWSISPPGSPWNTRPQEKHSLDLSLSGIAPQAVTSSSGEFLAKDMPKGYRLGVSIKHPRFSQSYVYVGTTDEKQADVEQPGRDEKPRPVEQSGFTAKLEPGWQVLGKVVFDDSNEPVAGAKVSITAASESRGEFQIADESGRFEFVSLPIPKWIVSANDPRGADAGYLAAKAIVDPEADQREVELELRVPRGEVVRGVVVDEKTGEGVADVSVAYVPPEEEKDTKPSSSAITDEEGKFSIYVPPGAGTIRVGGGIEKYATHDIPDFYRWRSGQGVSPGHSQEIDVAVGKRTHDVQLNVGRGLIIRGRVLDTNGNPAAGVAISVKDQYGRELGKSMEYVSDSDGRFEVSGMPPFQGAEIEFVASDGLGRGRSTIVEDDDAKSERVVDLGEVELRPTGTVRGRVLADGKPLAGVPINLSMRVEDLGQGRTRTRPAGRATTDAEGRFEFAAVEADCEYSTYFYSEEYTQTGSEEFTLKPGEVHKLADVKVQSRRAFVAGFVFDPQGEPVAGVTVSAQSTSGGHIGGASVKTNEQGHFHIKGVPEGDLQLMAYIRPEEPTKDRSIHFPAHVECKTGEIDVRIVLDPKLQRPLP